MAKESWRGPLLWPKTRLKARVECDIMTYFNDTPMPGPTPCVSGVGWVEAPQAYDTLQALAPLSMWISWRSESRNPSGDGPKTKIPYSVDGFRASATVPARWSTLAEVEEHHRAHPHLGGATGIMFAGLPDGTSLCGVDLDSCLSTAGVLAPWAAEIIGRLATYTEISPSGTGLKAFIRIGYDDHAALVSKLGWGAKWVQPGDHDGAHPPGVELFTGRRFFAVTGALWPGCSRAIRLIDQAGIAALLDHLGPPPAKAEQIPSLRTSEFFGEDDAPTDIHELAERLGVMVETDPRVARLYRGGGDFRRPTDRSSCAHELATALLAHEVSYSEMVFLLGDHPKTGAWTREKGFPNDARELKRLWERAPERDPDAHAEDEFSGTEAPPGVDLVKRPTAADRVAMAPTPGEKRAAISGLNAEESAPKRFNLLSLSDLRKLPPPSFLIGTLIPERGFSVLYSAPKVGKTFLALSMFMHVAGGRDWFGLKVKQAQPIIYVCGEDLSGVRLRVQALQEKYGFDDATPFWVVDSAVMLADGDSVDQMIQDIRAVVPDVPIGATIIDTLSRSIPGLDENTAQTMSLVVKGANLLREKLGCAVVAVHHQGKDATRGGRGNNALLGGLDAELHMERGEIANTVVLTTTHMKNGPAGHVRHFDLEKAEVEIDGETHETLIPVFVDRAPLPEASPRVTGNAGIALRAFEKTLATIGQPLPASVGHAGRGVFVDEWRAELLRDLPDETDPGVTDDVNRKRNSDRKGLIFKRAFTTLLNNQRIATRDSWVWLTPAPRHTPAAEEQFTGQTKAGPLEGL